ncbi:hypothetical protein DDZ13_14955 [Coraliomargarita sinensis]|uniref:Uncharacterized protein n=1 Tax=Coraliomargarita sinensis TaxID=2174842 RepID=A0A317ZEV0_9BACT|nr:hypothetical protein [Coraliomargarita sinensis]PXA02867.1 hypothetical protein DDZ13_14955 [Coraliomargarita sinensis]
MNKDKENLDVVDEINKTFGDGKAFELSDERLQEIVAAWLKYIPSDDPQNLHRASQYGTMLNSLLIAANTREIARQNKRITALAVVISSIAAGSALGVYLLSVAKILS